MKTRQYVIMGLLALALVFSPSITNAQTPPPGGGGGGSSKIGEIFSGLDHFTSHHTSQIDSLLNQILRLRIQLFGSPCGQDGAVYNYQTGQLCSLPPVTNSVIITSPAAGDIWRPGETRQIRWTTTGAFAVNERVQIDLVNTRYGLASGQLLSDGVVTINVPGDILPMGNYQIKISDYSQSNRWPDSYSGYFTISSSTSSNLPPTISGVSGPTTLNVGQSGTWTVTASDPENGSLAYAIRWGDETTNGKGASAPRGVANLQTATFTHTYVNAGTYTPTFIVTDNTGQSAQTSLSVVVGGGTGNNGLPRFNLPFPVSGTMLDFNLGAVDPDNDKLLYGLEFGDGLGIGILAPPNCQNGYPSGQPFPVRHTYTQPGTYRLAAVVIDCKGGEDRFEWDFTATGPSTIPSIVSSNPPNGAIDARGLRYSNDAGWGTLVITFSTTYPGGGPVVSDFGVQSTSDGNISITRVRPTSEEPSNGIKFEVGMSRGMNPGERIRITHTPSNSSICLGFLPGDVDQSGFSSFGDITYLAGLRQSNPNAPLYQTDIDRNGVFDVNDVTALGALFSAGQGDKALPACPSSPTGGSGSGGGGGASSFVSQSQLANSFSALSALLQSLRVSLAR